jgi:hypothetical protein
MVNKKYDTVHTFLKSYIKVVERDKIDTLTKIHDCPFYDFSVGLWNCSDNVLFLFFVFHFNHSSYPDLFSIFSHFTTINLIST